MEENNSQTINLNNLTGAQPPIFNQTSSSAIPVQDNIVTNTVVTPEEPVSSVVTTTVSTLNVNDSGLTVNPESVTITETLKPEIDSIVSDTPTQDNTVIKQEEPKTEARIPSQPVINDRFIVPVVYFKELISNASKAGSNESFLTTTQTINLFMNENGIRILTTSGDVDYECIDGAYRYTNKLEAYLELSQFVGLVSNLEDEGNIELIKNAETKALELKTETGGSFVFAEKVDPNSTDSVPIVLDIRNKTNYEEMTPINYEDLVNVIQLTKPARDEALKISKIISGIMFAGNIIASSDGNILTMRENVKGLTDYEIALPYVYCNLLSSLDFIPDKVRFGATKDTTGRVVNVCFSDGRTTLTGILNKMEDIPYQPEMCRDLWEQDYSKTVTLDTKKCYRLLNRIKPFVKIGSDNDYGEYKINGDILEVVTMEGTAQDVLNTVNEQGVVDTVYLSIEKVLKVLSSVSTPTFELSVNKGRNVACLKYEGFKSVIGESAH